MWNDNCVLKDQDFDPGMAASPLNIEDFEADAERSIVDQVLEPTIVCNGEILKHEQY